MYEIIDKSSLYDPDPRTHEPVPQPPPWPTEEELAADLRRIRRENRERRVRRPTLAFRRARELPPRGLRWLWPGRIPYGHLSLLVGDPGVGKSILLADLAARLTTAERCPIIGPQPKTAPLPGGVIIIAPEDSAEDTILPRLVAARAKLESIVLIDGMRSDEYRVAPDLPFRLPDHLLELEEALRTVPAPRLVILDTLATLIKSDCGDSDSLDRAIAGLNGLARYYDAAILATAHLIKSGSGRILYRVRGSLTIMGAARTAQLLSIDPQDPSRRVLTTIKSIYGPPAPPLSFTIADGPKIEWDDPNSTDRRVHNANIDPSVLQFSPDTHSVLADAADWLSDFLAAKPRPVSEILTAAHKAGFSVRTLHRVKRLLGIRSIKLPDNPSWQWTLRGAAARSDLQSGEHQGCQLGDTQK